MKILFVSIPNHHFFQWANQLKDSGHEVYWFDITDGAGFSSKIDWVTQYAGWKIKWNYPFRHRVKKYFPQWYSWIQNRNERSAAKVFSRLVERIQPDVIHVFEMQLAGYPIFSVLQKYAAIPLIYSSWGSDMFQYERLGLTTTFVQRFLQRVDFLITDCHRDHDKALSLGFKNTFLGVFPGNGGIHFLQEAIQPQTQRKYIMVKGYEDGVGKALVILKAMAHYIPQILEEYKLIVYSADEPVLKYLGASAYYQKVQPMVFPRNQHQPNEQILTLMGQSALHVASSVSDGMPNVVLEAMGMGAFPIQSNPGQVTEEVIQHGKNGLLIAFPESEEEIANLMRQAITNSTLREEAQEYNVNFMHSQYERDQLRAKIVALYSQILQ
ncbi:glycosyltransferase family 4 protein [Flavobacterium luminosum]|uniref:Glycosyltransferase family 4 protein n=1 Tax=Flavobacterium luminosum TaxID=2949086 RepID=A0ABT0TNL3_9FLAO|nr:glycosyltransferase family 4 protein [Flavobacterium sp. HXWNR70]MCL9809088.1 glycosyltransferase family 4 protein [Flavobacterium sp. HXWNR70]